jgi:hypothetical protein
VSRDDHGDIECQYATERCNQAVEIAIAQPGKATVEQQVTEKSDLAPLKVDYDVAITVGRPEIVQAYRVVRQMERKTVAKSLARPDRSPRYRNRAN